MKKKNENYQLPEHEGSSLREPEIAYQPNVQVVNESYLASEQAEQEMTDDRNDSLRRLLKASAIHALESHKRGEGYTTREVMEEVGKRLAFF
ncbi:MAG: hypothetical protein PARBA_01061 [Parabacteroides sp.]